MNRSSDEDNFVENDSDVDEADIVEDILDSYTEEKY